MLITTVVIAALSCYALAGPVPMEIKIEDIDWKNGGEEMFMKILRRNRPVAPPSPCPEGWVFSREFAACYKKIVNVNFEEAEAECKKEGANLASIHSDAENQLLYKMVKTETPRFSDQDQLLLGARRVDGEWMWIDGTKFDYKPWAQGEPNDWQYTSEEAEERFEDCVAMYTSPLGSNEPVHPYLGRWNDNVCEGTYEAAICKKKPHYIHKIF
ncbi:unnamed protein product, partial [Mesorhabditis spiculigera]